MSGRAKCPACGTAVAVPAASGGAVECPSCGAKLNFKVRPRAAVEAPAAAAPTRAAVAPVEPRRPPNPGRAGARRKRADKVTDEQRFKRRLIAGIAGGVLAVLLVVGGAAWFWGGRGRNPGSAGGGPDGAGNLDGPPPYDPVAWSVPLGGAPPLFPTDKIDLAVALLPNGQGDYFALGAGASEGDFRVIRGRVDPQTGAAVDDHALEDIVPFQVRNPNRFPEPASAAVAPDGTLAAWRADGLPRPDAPRKNGKVMFWDKGSAKPQPTAGPACSTDHWFDWAANGKLLLLHGGKLTLWDVAGGKPVFEVGKSLQRPILLAPSRQWVIVRVGNPDPGTVGYLEVFDTATGEVRGRFGAGRMFSLALSPDGTRLAGAQRINPYEDDQVVEVHHWDLKTGERQGVIRGHGSSTGTLRGGGPTTSCSPIRGSSATITCSTSAPTSPRAWSASRPPSRASSPSSGRRTFGPGGITATPCSLCRCRRPRTRTPCSSRAAPSPLRSPAAAPP